MVLAPALKQGWFIKEGWWQISGIRFSLSAKFYGILVAGLEAIAAVRAVHFIRARTHFAFPETGVAVVTGVGLEDTEQGNMFYDFQDTAHGTEETAPGVGYENTGSNDADDDSRADEPGREGMLEGQVNRIPEISDPDRHHHARVIEAEIDIEAGAKHEDHADLGKADIFAADPQFAQGYFAKHLIDEASGAEPAAEGPAEEEGRYGQEHPKAPEVRRDSAPAGNDRAVLATHEGDEEGAAEDSVKSPFAQDAQHDELYEAAQLGQYKIVCFFYYFISHLLPPAFQSRPCPFLRRPE